MSIETVYCVAIVNEMRHRKCRRNSGRIPEETREEDQGYEMILHRIQISEDK